MTNFDDEYNKYKNNDEHYEDSNENEDEYDEDEDDYTIGYCKPPKHTQFKKGQSGNPKGRPKPSENPAEALAKELSKTIPVKENGQTKNIKVMDAIAKRAVAMALKGDVPILRKFLSDAIIDPILFKSALRDYNHDPKTDPKPLSPKIKLLVNTVKKGMREEYKEVEKRKRGIIE